MIFLAADVRGLKRILEGKTLARKCHVERPRLMGELSHLGGFSVALLLQGQDSLQLKMAREARVSQSDIFPE
ncbi:MAG: hypothetical protein D6715_08875 [Calditrichaeota bacterium]|nr:MAG: hypothetical protein D6715_08875 [Calditrichota bacterium]